LSRVLGALGLRVAVRVDGAASDARPQAQP
jgi:hypothetical protein